jgi:hypothetical protein
MYCNLEEKTINFKAIIKWEKTIDTSKEGDKDRIFLIKKD